MSDLALASVSRCLLDLELLASGFMKASARCVRVGEGGGRGACLRLRAKETGPLHCEIANNISSSNMVL